MSEDRLAFLPNALPAVLDSATAPASGSTRLNLGYDLQVTVNGADHGAAVPVTTELKGPGDVIGFNQSAIRRLEPRRGLRAFEPSYFPFVEFHDADFLWRYSLDQTGGQKRMPWLSLIVLQADEFSFVDATDGPLDQIDVNAVDSSLPSLDQAWATAHVQVNGDHYDDNVLHGNADTDFCRLICPRQLEPLRSYYSFIVPTYEAGRLAGLGQDSAQASFAEQAWMSGDVKLRLPVYFQWRFTTDAMEDVEVLVRRLTGLAPERLTDFVTRQKADAASPGYYPDYVPGQNVNTEFEIQSAMRLIGEAPAKLETDNALMDRMTVTLEDVIQGEIDSDPNGEDPLVAFPPYGFRFQQETQVSKSLADKNKWFDRINLDLKFRHAASLGAKIVRENQEVFSHICWEQYDEIVAANEALVRLQAASHMAESLTTRHFKTLPSDVALTLAQPLQALVSVSADASLANDLSKKGIPLSYTSRALRAQASKRPVAAQEGDAPGARRPAQPAVPGDKTASQRIDKTKTETRAVDVLMRKSSTRDDASKPLSSAKRVARLKRQSQVEPELIDKLAQTYRGQLGELFETDRFVEKWAVGKPVMEVAQSSSDLLVKPLADTLTRLPEFKARVRVQGLTEVEQEKVVPVWRSPRIDIPIVDALRAVDPAALLSGSDDLPDNTIAFVEENRMFIEAVMAGMNHEMQEELIWREFATDGRGTIFRRFWNRHLPESDRTGDDIQDIHLWQKELGRNAPSEIGNSDENLIVVIKGDIIRKLDNPIVAVNFSASANDFELDRGTEQLPVFTGKLGPDTAYYGFEVSLQEIKAQSNKAFFVIYEPLGDVRFGLDVGTAAVRRARIEHTAHGYGFPMRALTQLPRARFDADRVMQRSPATTTPPSSSGNRTWDDLSWSDMRVGSAGYVDFSKNFHLSGSMERLWSANKKTSATLARSFLQKPIAAVLPLRRVI